MNECLPEKQSSQIFREKRSARTRALPAVYWPDVEDSNGDQAGSDA